MVDIEQVTQEQAIKFLEHACRNINMPRLTEDDLGDIRDGLQHFIRQSAEATTIERYREALEASEHKLRMIVSHASGGNVDLAETGPLPTNEIAVRISQHHNAIWAGAKEAVNRSEVPMPKIEEAPKTEAFGTANCPVCGRNYPHAHSSKVLKDRPSIDGAQEAFERSAGPIAQKFNDCGLRTGSGPYKEIQRCTTNAKTTERGDWWAAQSEPDHYTFEVTGILWELWKAAWINRARQALSHAPEGQPGDGK